MKYDYYEVGSSVSMTRARRSFFLSLSLASAPTGWTIPMNAVLCGWAIVFEKGVVLA